MEKEFPLSIAILYGTSHSNSTDMTSKIRLEQAKKHKQQIYILDVRLLWLPGTRTGVRVQLKTKSSDEVVGDFIAPPTARQLSSSLDMQQTYIDIHLGPLSVHTHTSFREKNYL